MLLISYQQLKCLAKEKSTNLRKSGPEDSLQAAVHESQQRYLADYTHVMQDFKDDSLRASLNYENISQMGLGYNQNNYVVLRYANYDYSGGAHGMRGIDVVIPYHQLADHLQPAFAYSMGIDTDTPLLQRPQTALGPPIARHSSPPNAKLGTSKISLLELGPSIPNAQGVKPTSR